MRRHLFVLLIGVLGAAVLIGLGVWQMQRLAWKEGILAEISDRMDAALPGLPVEPNETLHEYRLLRLTGVIAPEELHVLTSARPEGAGYRIIAPFTLADGRRLLLDRGFVAQAQKAAPRPGGTVEITGNLLWPDETTDYTPLPDQRRNIWFARNVETMAVALDTEPVMFVARSGTGDGIRPLPISVNIPNDHLEYAITWFGLATGWSGMTLLFLLRGRRAAKPLESRAARH
ncbi:MAG: SURF1 family protein [Pseudomonadota bacterium]